MSRPDPINVLGELLLPNKCNGWIPSTPGDDYSKSLLLMKMEVEEQVKRTLKTTTDLIYSITPKIEHDATRLEELQREAKVAETRMKDCKDFLNELQDLNVNKVENLIELAEQVENLVDSIKRQ